jgi:hypothetical protein
MESSSKYSLGQTMLRKIDPDHGLYTIIEIRHILEKDGTRTVWYYLDKALGRYLACSLEDEFSILEGESV